MKLIYAFCLSVGMWVGVQLLYCDAVPDRTAAHMVMQELPAAIPQVPTPHPWLLSPAFMLIGCAILVCLAVFIRSQCRPVPKDEDDVTLGKRSC